MPALSDSSRLITRHEPNLSQRDLLAALQRFAGLRVAVVGEVIIDEYVYCDALGKSGKEPMLVSRYVSSECQGGGVLAVANHLSEFCRSVELVSALGELEPREEFVLSSLRRNVRPHFIRKGGSPTIVKRRYLDAYTLAKMMGVYHLNPNPLSARDEEAYRALLGGVLPDCDLVIVADYGHGLISPGTVQLLCDRSRFLCINTQMNAANQGYHTLSKYPRADYACLHEGELRLDARDLNSDLGELIQRAADRLGARAFTVTRGKKGSLSYRKGERIVECPSLAREVVERVGAGDAVLALSSLGAACDLDSELLGTLGNLAGAQQVAVVGNRASVSKEKLVGRVRELFPTRSRVKMTAL
jgi:bifunctional ADP-heptose synthase (sugar kinase/adenylyltransferase)